jgi:hypothetical protein
MARISDSLNVRLRMIEELGKLYWGDYGYAQKRNFIAAKKDWKTALELFLRNYAFQRLRGFPRYSNAAIQAFKNVARKSVRPPRNVTTAVWKKFLEILELPNDGHGANKKVNPMVPTREGGKRPLLSFISALENHVYNIVSWAEYMLRNGKAAAAFAEVESV